MLILITGGSGSGKSAFAEQKLLEIASEQGKNCIYLATMSRGEDGESAARIRRHRALRAGKGFGTVEQPLRLDEANIPDGSAVLLEDLSNLLANEIYLPGGQLAIKERTEEQLAEAVLGPVLALAERASVLVVVTNEIFSDGVLYDEETEAFRKDLAILNREIASRADAVYEVVAGIPLIMKEMQTERDR